MIDQTHIYSYSQLSSFSECPFGFYLERIEKVPTVSNGFAEKGTLIHEILDEWAKGLLTKANMAEAYQQRYADAVVTAFPRMLTSKGYTEKAYQQGLKYLEEFDEFEGFEVLSAEEKFTTTLPMPDETERGFVGIVDLVLKDKKTNELIICDHKSKSLASFRKSEESMYRQQLMYSLFIFEKYHQWPDRLMFNLFNENVKREKPFSKEQYDQTMLWAMDCIRHIEDNTILDWMQTKEHDFFCDNLCSVRQECFQTK